MTKHETIDGMLAERIRIVEDLSRAQTAATKDEEFLSDRIRDLEYLNRQLQRLGTF